jgi:hypothetical protein
MSTKNQFIYYNLPDFIFKVSITFYDHFRKVSATCSFQYKLTYHFKTIRLLKQDSYFKIIEVSCYLKISNQTSAV